VYEVPLNRFVVDVRKLARARHGPVSRTRVSIELHMSPQQVEKYSAEAVKRGLLKERKALMDGRPPEYMLE